LIRQVEKIPHIALYKFSLLVVTGILICSFVIPQFVYHKVWIILVFFVLLTLASLAAIEKITKKNQDNFLAIYFSVMIGRLFISIIFAVVFFLTDREHLFNFSFNFLILYLLFLGFEIYGIITNLRHHFKKGTGDE
jgi:hypothetical protein